MDTTDTTAADNQQLAGILDALAGLRHTAIKGEVDQFAGNVESTTGPGADLPATDYQGDPQWAGPSLPHPTEAGSEAEADELRQGWDDEVHGIEPNQEQLEA